MIVLAGGLLGILWGAFQARRNQGDTKDMAQWATACGIAGLLLGLIATVALERLLT